MKRRGCLIAIIAVVVIIGVVVLAIASRLSQVRAAVTAAANTTAPVERRNLDDVLSATGTLKPARNVSVSFEVNGTVREVNVRNGQSVKSGDVLAQLDTTQLEYQLQQAKNALIIQQANFDTVNKPATEREIAQARAALAQAEAQLSSAQAAFDNQQNAIIQSCANLTTAEDNLRVAQKAYDDYVSQGFQFDVDFRPDMDSASGKALKQARNSYDVAKAACESARRTQSSDAAVKAAQASVDQAKSALDALLKGATDEQIATAQAQLARAKLDLEQAERNLTKATLIAPVDGIITTLNLVVGQVVGAGGQAVIILADTSQLYVNLSLDESDITRVKEGQEARFTLQGFPQDQEFKGVIESKNTSGVSTQGVVAYEVLVRVTDTIEPFLGMTADVQIIMDTREDVLVVPTRAIFRDSEGQYVLVKPTEGDPVRINVTTGLTVDDVTEISGEGLREGQAVLLTNTRAQGGGFGLGVGQRGGALGR
ncbi:MAG: hypothetical protein OHK0023_03780 [Anaerolineae bacterium]